jgi:hypothetical protein
VNPKQGETTVVDEGTNGHYDIPENEQPAEEKPDLVAELAALGKRFGEALEAAWHSEERVQLQSDIKEGMDRFASEVNKSVKDIRASQTAQRVEEGMQKAAADVKSGKVADEVRRATVTALRSLSDALERMASSFTPVEEAPEDEPETPAE